VYDIASDERRQRENCAMLKKIIAGAALYAVLYGGANLTGVPSGAFSSAGGAQTDVKDTVIAYSTRDAAMNAAKAMGRKSLPRFEKMWAARAPGTFSVKIPLTQNGKTEHIWMQIDGFADNLVIGRLANEPVNGTQYKMGQDMTALKSDVEDWMIRDGDAIWGAYTARVMLASMPKDEAAVLKAMLRD
jgi:uncharacterized protein YegJ (DUF2314 family)